MNTVAIIRDRGQLTIPDSVRKIAHWAGISSVVSISMNRPDEIVITPHKVARETEWDKLLELINKSREFKGRGSMKAVDFIAESRQVNKT